MEPAVPLSDCVSRSEYILRRDVSISDAATCPIGACKKTHRLPPIPAKTAMAQLRLRHPNGVSTIQVDLESATVQDLLQEIYKITEILPSRQDGASVTFGSS